MRLLEPWPLAWVIDAIAAELGKRSSGAPGSDSLGALILVAAGGVAVIVGLRAVASYAMTICFALAGNRVLTGVRADLFAHLTRLSLNFYDKRRTGDLVTRVTGDIGRLQEATVTAALPLTGNLVTLAGMLVVIAVLDWQLAVVVLLIFPVFGLLSVRLSRKISAVSRTQRGAEGELASLATESLASMTVVQSYGLEGKLQQQFSGSNMRSLTDGVRAKKLSAGLERKTDVLVGVATAAVLFVGAHRVLSGELSLGELTVFLTYLKTAFKPMRDVAKYTGRLAKAAASGERVIAILDEKPDLTDTSWARPAPRFCGHVSFEDVRLSYPGGPEVLTGLSFSARPGERVALVGPSGTGKSTIVALLSRLRDPDGGRVSIDGHDLRDLTLESVRAQVSVVLQESVLFACSIAENIALGAGVPVTGQQIEQAARIAQAHEFIMRLPQGYQTVVGERGSTLSGGQRQRIAIARAAIRQAPIVILDEALSGLDQATEADVVTALIQLTAGRTTLIVTHDLEEAAGTDHVVWLDGGQVRRAGAPADIIGELRHAYR